MRFRTNTTDSLNLQTQDYQHIDRDHIWHPLYQHKNLKETQLTVFEQGEGVFLTDNDGSQYLDAYSGLWNGYVGYGRQEIAEAVYKQIQKLPYYPLSQINKPILGINFGGVGFLNELEPDSDIFAAIDNIINKKYYEEKLHRIDTYLNGLMVGTAVNEIVLHTSRVAKIQGFEVSTNGNSKPLFVRST